MYKCGNTRPWTVKQRWAYTSPRKKRHVNMKKSKGATFEDHKGGRHLIKGHLSPSLSMDEKKGHAIGLKNKD